MNTGRRVRDRSRRPVATVTRPTPPRRSAAEPPRSTADRWFRRTGRRHPTQSTLVSAADPRRGRHLSGPRRRRPAQSQLSAASGQRRGRVDHLGRAWAAPSLSLATQVITVACAARPRSNSHEFGDVGCLKVGQPEPPRAARRAALGQQSPLDQSPERVLGDSQQCGGLSRGQHRIIDRCRSLRLCSHLIRCPTLSHATETNDGAFHHCYA